MESNINQILTQLTELTKDLNFPISESLDPIFPFFWDTKVQGEFTLEKLLKTAILNFNNYSIGGPIIQAGDLESYLQFCLQESQKYNLETYQKYQDLIDLLTNNLNLELLNIREMYDAGSKFRILIGVTQSGEWLGIAPNIMPGYYTIQPYSNPQIG